MNPSKIELLRPAREPRRRRRRRLPAVAGLAALCVALLCAASAAHATPVRVIASHLNQPKKITVAPDGSLVVALSGTGVAPAGCTDGEQVACASRTGAVDAISASGRVTPLLTGLSSVSSGGTDPQATGPAQAAWIRGRLLVLFQNSTISQTTGDEIFGSRGSELGELEMFSGSSSELQAGFGPFEALHDPDRGAGTDVAYGEDARIGSDPYSFVAYRGGYAVADAGANDVLFVSPSGRIHVLAVLPTISEYAKAGTFGKRQRRAGVVHAQAVPDALAVGRDGALYVGELGGMPYNRGTSSVYRVVPGQKPAVWARGFTAIEDMAFDSRGRLDVLEIDRRGLADPGFATGTPASGAIVRVADGHKRTLVSSGLVYPTGIAVTGARTAWVTDHGVSSANQGTGGQLLEVPLP